MISFLGGTWVLGSFIEKSMNIYIPGQNHLIFINFPFHFLNSIFHFLNFLVSYLFGLWSQIIQFINFAEILANIIVVHIVFPHQLFLSVLGLESLDSLETTIKAPDDEIVGMIERLFSDHVSFIDSILVMGVFGFEFLRIGYWVLLFILKLFAHIKNGTFQIYIN